MKKIFLTVSLLLMFGTLPSFTPSVPQKLEEPVNAKSSSMQAETADNHSGSYKSSSKFQYTKNNLPQTAEGKVSGSTSQLTVELNFTRGSTKASSQYAIWIENDAGELIKTLYVSDFTASGGYAFRDDAVSKWVAKANPGEMADEEIDAISGSTPQSGIQRYTWDGTDATGKAVMNGTYHIYVEGTLYWSSIVLFSGDIEWGDSEQNITLTATYSEENTTENRDMLTNVMAIFLMSVTRR